MVETKERIYLTDITLHLRDFKQTVNYATAAKRGRMYSPMKYPANSAQETNSPSTGSFHLKFNFPPELQERIKNGEVEIMVPEGGLFVFAGRDVHEHIRAKERRSRRELIHRSRPNPQWTK